MSKVGFIGLGIMGAPMAGHLQAGGHELFVNTIGPYPEALVKGGAKVCADGAEVARNAEGLSAGKLVIDMSSISPIETKEFAKRVNALGCEYVDAPVSGGEVGAKAA